jgi:peptide/nickel transport system substrate-binding protein
MSRFSKVLRLLIPLIVIVSSIGTAAGSSSRHPAAAPKSIVVAAQGPAAVIDPMFSNSYQTREIAAHAFDTLVSFNEKFAIIPNLATKWKVTGGNTVWTFTIAQKIKFQDGETLKAADVAASLNRYIKYGVGGAGFGTNIDSVTAPSKYTVRITLKTANPNLLPSLANPLTFIAIMPAKFASSTTALTPPNLIGTGPYRITAYIPNQYTDLTLFKGYTPPSKLKPSGYGGNRKGTVNKIRYQVILEQQTRLAGVQTGQFQYAEFLPYAAYSSIHKSKRNQAFVIDPGTKAVMYVNQWSGPLTNVYLRRAMVEALDANSVMKFITGNQKRFYRLDSSIFFPQQKLWYYPTVAKNVYNHPNKNKVKADLARANYHGEEISILTNQDFPYMFAMASTAAAQWQAMGINAKLNTMTWPSQLTYLPKHEGWSLFTSGNSLRFDPSVYSSQFQPGGSLNFGYNSASMIAAMTKGLSTRNIKQRQKAYKKVQELVWTDVPMIQFGDFMSLDAGARSLTGYRPWYTGRFWTVH